MWIDQGCDLVREMLEELEYGGRGKKLKNYPVYNIKLSVGQSEIVRALIEGL